MDEEAYENKYNMFISAFSLTFYMFVAIWPDRGPAGRGVGGKVNLPPIKVLITPRRVGEYP